jgi:hypothetical protein
MFSKLCFVLCGTLLLYFALKTFSASATMMVPAPTPGLSPLPIPKLVPMRGRRKVASDTVMPYTLVDIGTPWSMNPAAFTNNQAPGSYGPIALNNTGQILGSAAGTRFVGSIHPAECVLWTGTKFINIDSSRPLLSSCTATALTDEDPKTKTLWVAGSVGYSSEPSVPYLAKVYVPQGIVSPVILYGRPPTTFLGFGSNGVPIGYKYYAPLHQNSFSNTAVPSIYSSGQITLLQPNCDVVGGTDCLGSILSVNGETFGTCSQLGYCIVNQNGQATGVPAIGVSCSTGFNPVQPITVEQAGYLGAVDASGDLIGNVYCSYQSGGFPEGFEYHSTTGTFQPIIDIFNCFGSQVSAISSGGIILGTKFECSGLSSTQDFVYNPAAGGGLFDLSDSFSEPPTGEYVTPLPQINNKAQVLVLINNTNGNDSDWGLLTPTVIAPAEVKRRKIHTR